MVSTNLSANLRELPRMITEGKGLSGIQGISLAEVHEAQQAALMRLQLYMTGEVHRLLADYADRARAVLLRWGDREGKLDAASGFMALQGLLEGWNDFFMEGWLPLLQAARREAASIPFGVLALYHEEMVRGHGSVVPLREAVANPVFEPQLQALMDAANQRIYQDGLNLSGRIWRLDRESREGINRVLMQGVQESKSAWQIAKDMEQFLGPGRDCPRWTSTRLYQLTKKDIASGDRRGLKTGEECKGQGVSYNALRMTRTELQAIHHMASDDSMAAQPWIEKEQVVLSPAHPVEDICDEVIAAGEGGQGIYEKGTVELPLHPNCICFKVAVLQDEEAFIGRLRDWINGAPDPGMDRYATFLGVPAAEVPEVSFLDNLIGMALGVWLFGGREELAGRMGV